VQALLEAAELIQNHLTSSATGNADVHPPAVDRAFVRYIR